ncbi:MAG TPA: murein L,D-transpeptidase catalytic domain family protein [Povalibacter sp.]
MKDLSRRQLLLGALATGAALAVPEAVFGTSTSDTLLNRARRELDRVGRDIPRQDVVGLADYSHPSSTPRFHLVGMRSGNVDSFLVSHGRGSDPGHSGWVRRFSNQPGSNASSEGAYLTGDYYSGKHGRSMRLVGLDPTNSNAEQRAIVVHGAWYVGPDMLRLHGQLGRSEGCFAFAESQIDTILRRLGPGRLLLSTKL